MTYKRRALQALTKTELLEVGRELELEVAARMSVDEVRDVVARSKRATLERVLPLLSRDNLKAICEELGLPSDGREKEPIIERILGKGGDGADEDDEADDKSNGSAGSDPEPAAPEKAAGFSLAAPEPKEKKKREPRAPRSPSSGGAGGEGVADYRHDATRANNPPAGLIEFDRPPPQPTKTYAYDPHLDPTLQWAGKAEHTSFDVDTVSLHIHERVSTQAILRAVKREPAQRSLFAVLDLPESKVIDFYRHEVDWANRMVLGDSLLVMNSLLEREHMAGKVQCIYIDPPYGVKFNSNFQPSVNKRDVKDGDDGSLTREPEQIQAYRDTWQLGIHSYLTYMRDRLLLARELLAESGSIFVQISDDNVHHLRELLDDVFGADNFCGLITFKKTGVQTSTLLAPVSDYILWYARARAAVKFHSMFKPMAPGEGHSTGERYDQVLLPDGSVVPAGSLEHVPGGSRFFRTVTLSSNRPAKEHERVPFRFEGRDFLPPTNRTWTTTVDGFTRLVACGRIRAGTTSLNYLKYLDDFPANPLGTLWEDLPGAPDKIYVVQTNSKIIARCLLMTTDPGDLVLDPTCGSGTTAFVAEQWGRRWITCDTSRVALTLARQRLLTAKFPYYRLRSDRVRDGFVYKTVPHITLKSIAQNPKLDECKTREERERVIRESADQEILYDQPEADNGRVRVAGPFTVEAIPVASLHEEDDAGTEATEAAPPVPSADAGSDYLGMMMDLVRRSGVQFAKTGHLPLPNLRAVRGPFEWLHAETETGSNGGTKRVAVSFGPRHAPVTPMQVLTGIAETRGYDLVVFVGFACDPEARRVIDAGVTPREPSARQKRSGSAAVRVGGGTVASAAASVAVAPLGFSTVTS